MRLHIKFKNILAVLLFLKIIVAQGPGTLLYDHFGVTLLTQSSHSGGTNRSFDWNSFVPTLNTGTANFVESDWYGNWNFSDFGDGTNTIQHTPAPGTADLDYHPSGDEPYDVEAMYFDDDATNLYVVIVTSVAHYVAANNDVGIVDARISSTDALVRPGDLSINLFDGSPRIERNSSEWHYNFGVDITHENRDNIISVGGYNTRSMRNFTVGNELYKTGYDAGGSNNLNPSDSDWYTSLVDGVVEANWEHTNFDPQSTTKTADLSYLGNTIVNYYEYDFGGGLQENGYPTYIYEFTIPRHLLGAADPCASDPIGIQWIEGCRNDGNADVPAISLTGTADVCNYSSIGDFVWDDTDQDGIQNGGELGLENVTVNLFYSGGGSAGSTTTDANGNYSFLSLTPGDYYLEFVLPSGYSFSPQDLGGNDATDSDADITTGQTITTTLTSGENDIFWDAGIYYSGSCPDNLLSNPGFEDDLTDWSPNGNVTITNDAHLGLKAATLTDGLGTNIIQIIPATVGRIYSLTVFAKKTLNDYADVGWYFLDSGGGELQDVPIEITSIGIYQYYTIEAVAPPGTVSIRAYAWPGNNAVNVITVDEYCLTEGLLGTVGDYVWLDGDLDGLQNDGATGIENVKLTLFDGTSTSVGETYTNANGWYEFVGLPADNYTIIVDDLTLPSEIDVQTYDYDGLVSPHAAQFTLTEGETNLNLDFGYGITPLPVTLSGFNVEIYNNQVKLTWATQSEVENQGFFINRKLINESEWQELSNFIENPGLRGQGSTTRKTEYEFVDSTALSGFTYEYRLGDIDYNTAKYYHNNRIIRIEVIYTAIPDNYYLQPAYPNPFNPYTTISYSLPKVEHVRLNVYDINGNLVRKLVNGVENPGIKNISWDSKNEFGEDVPSGMYIYTFQAANFKRSKKILLIR